MCSYHLAKELEASGIDDAGKQWTLSSEMRAHQGTQDYMTHTPLINASRFLNLSSEKPMCFQQESTWKVQMSIVAIYTQAVSKLCYFAVLNKQTNYGTLC